MSKEVATMVQQAEQRRCAAMIANDTVQLEALLDPRLQFHHATGAVDDKTALLAKMAGGRIKYAAIAWSEEQVVELSPDAALLTGRMTTDVEVEGVAKQLKNRVMTVWSLGEHGWRLLAFQSTPIAG